MAGLGFGYALKDAGRRIRAFVCSGSCTYDANGWPQTGTNSNVIFTGGARGKVSGWFIEFISCFYSGTGTITYSNNVSRDAAASSAGHDVVTVTNNNADFTYTTNGRVYDVKIIMPGGDCGDEFTFAASASSCSSRANFDRII